MRDGSGAISFSNCLTLTRLPSKWVPIWPCTYSVLVAGTAYRRSLSSDWLGNVCSVLKTRMQVWVG